MHLHLVHCLMRYSFVMERTFVFVVERSIDRHLKISQLERLYDPDRYIYTENCSKNHAGTFDQLHVQSKVVPVYCTCSNAATANSRCLVHLLDTYISKLTHRTNILLAPTAKTYGPSFTMVLKHPCWEEYPIRNDKKKCVMMLGSVERKAIIVFVPLVLQKCSKHTFQRRLSKKELGIVRWQQ